MNFFRPSRIKKGFAIEPEEIFLDSMNALHFERALHEGRIEQSISSSFFSFIVVVCVTLCIVFGGRIIYLQVVEGDTLYTSALSQSLIVSTIPPPRGQIVDGNGVSLAKNISSFDVVLYGAEFKKGHISLDQLKSNLLAILPSQHAPLFDDFPVDSKRIPQELTLLRNIDTESILRIQSHIDRLPGIFIEERFQRFYEPGKAFSPIIGYVGVPAQNEYMPEEDSGTLVGKLGLEKQYNDVLKGRAGKKIIQVDASRKIQKIKTIDAPRAGATLELYLDADLQQEAYNVLSSAIVQSGRKAGAVVIVDPKNGAVRTLVSYPSFENSLFTKSLSRNDYNAIFLNSAKPLYNRAISGEYSPGSSIKPVIASAALSEHIIDPLKQIFSAGFIKIPNPFQPGVFSIFKDWKTLGWVDVRHALAFSSNVYFYSIGGGYEDQIGLGIDRIKKYENLFGLGSKLGIDLPGESPGFVPDPVWKAEKRSKDPIWRIGDTYNVSIGQGDTLVTPLQVASYTAAIANNGTLYQPHIVHTIIDPDTKALLKKFDPVIIRKNFIDQSVLQIVREGMRLAVTDGVARSLSSVSAPVAGKTGTAQTGVDKISGEEQAWFTGFAPYNDPELVITVLVEKGGEGSSIAVPIAKKILQWYFDRKQNQSTTATTSPAL